MNKIVREHYPVSKLPDDLRVGLNPLGTVTLELREEDVRRMPPTREELFRLLRAAKAANKGKGITTKDAVERIRELRDEWDD